MEEKSAEFVQILWARDAAAHPGGQLHSEAFDLSEQISQRHQVAVVAAQSTISCARLLESDRNSKRTALFLSK